MFYFDISKQSCLPCQDVNCKQCKQNEQTCDICDVNYYLQDGKCLSQCDQGYFSTTLNNSNICQQCSLFIINCQLCEDQSGCKTCQYGYYKTSQNLCVSQCPDGFSQNEMTRQCDPLNIANCKTYHLDKCIECTSQYLKIIDHSCELDCPLNLIPNYETNACDQQGCTSLQFFYNSECLDNCPQNTIPNSNTKTCDLIQSKSFNLQPSEEQNTIILTFSKGFIPNFNSLKSKIKIKLNISVGFTYVINQIDEQSYKIKFDLKNNAIDQQVLNINLNGLQCEGNLGMSLLPYVQEINVSIKYEINQSDLAATKTVTEVTAAITKSVVVGSFSLIFTSYFQILSTLVELTELIYFTIFLDILQDIIILIITINNKYFNSYYNRKPFNLEEFLHSFSTLSMSFFPNFFQGLFGKFEFQSSYSAIDEQKYTSYFIANTGQLFTVIAFIGLIHGFLQGLLLLLKNGKHSKLFKLIQNCKDKIVNSTYLTLLYIVYLQFAFNTTLQMTNIQKDGFENILSLILLSLSCIFILPVPFVVYFLIKKKYDLPFLKSFYPEQIYPEYMLLLYIRKLIYSLIIISLYGQPYLQITILVIMNILIIAYVIWMQPFNKKSNNIKNILEEFIFLFTIMLLYFLVDFKFFEEDQRMNISWGLIMLFVSVIITEVICIVLFGIVKLKELYQNFKKNKIQMKVKPIQVQPSKSFSLTNIDGNMDIKSIEDIFKNKQMKIVEQAKIQNNNDSASIIMNNTQEKEDKYKKSREKQLKYQFRRKRKNTQNSFESFASGSAKTIMISHENIFKKSNFSKEGNELPFFFASNEQFTSQFAKQESPLTMHITTMQTTMHTMQTKQYETEQTKQYEDDQTKQIEDDQTKQSESEQIKDI